MTPTKINQTIADGGPAFLDKLARDMTRREHIATAALQGMCQHAHYRYETGPCNAALVERAVVLANALIAELNK